MKTRTRPWIALVAIIGLAACGGSGAQETATGEAGEEAVAEQPAAEQATAQTPETGSEGASAGAGEESTASQTPAGADGDASAGRSGSSASGQRGRSSASTGGAATGTSETGSPSRAAAADESRPSESPPAAEEPATVSLESGTELRLTLGREISTETAQVGDAFTASLERPVIRGDFVVLPAGATVNGRVTAVQKAGDGKPAAVKLHFETIEVREQLSQLQATLTEASPKTRSKMTDKLKKIGGGAGAGAVLGAIIGGGAKEAVFGAAAGAAAGSAVALGTQEQTAYLPEGSPMTLRLDAPLTVPAPGSSGG